MKKPGRSGTKTSSHSRFGNRVTSRHRRRPRNLSEKKMPKTSCGVCSRKTIRRTGTRATSSRSCSNENAF
ncbi:MAG: hypothetical protein ABR611_14035 [Chthoniobacterales bacterium]